MGPRAPDLHYVPYDQLDGRASVVVDGSPAPGTVLCLSHWPGIGSPAEFAAGSPAVDAESALDVAAVRAAVETHLRTAPPAWDPYRVTR